MINDKLDVSKRIIELLIPGLYVEELLGVSTAELADSTPKIRDVPNDRALKIKWAAAILVILGAILYGIYALLGQMVLLALLIGAGVLVLLRRR